MFEQQPPPAQRNFYFYLSTAVLISLLILLTVFSWKALTATAQQGPTTYREAPADFEETCNEPYRSYQKYYPLLCDLDQRVRELEEEIDENKPTPNKLPNPEQPGD